MDREDEWQDARVVPAGYEESVSVSRWERKREGDRETRPWCDNERASTDRAGLKKSKLERRITRLPPTRSFVTRRIVVVVVAIAAASRCSVSPQWYKAHQPGSTIRHICPNGCLVAVTMAAESESRVHVRLHSFESRRRSRCRLLPSLLPVSSCVSHCPHTSISHRRVTVARCAIDSLRLRFFSLSCFVFIFFLFFFLTSISSGMVDWVLISVSALSSSADGR